MQRCSIFMSHFHDCLVEGDHRMASVERRNDRVDAALRMQLIHVLFEESVKTDYVEAVHQAYQIVTI